MESLLTLFVHNRPKILAHCINTLFGNTSYKFDEVLIINDDSNVETTNLITNFALKNKFTLIHFGKNQGYGGSSEVAFNYARMRNPKYYFHIESDYIFRKNWAEDVLAVLEASPDSLAVAGYSHPDFYNEVKTKQEYSKLVIDEYGDDPMPRNFLYNPFLLETKRGGIEVQGTSNSCGTCYVNWHNFMNLNRAYPEYWEKVLDRASNKVIGDRKTYGDGHFSCGSAWYWYHYFADQGEDFSKNFAWLDICGDSVANHICGGEDSINGYIAPEGATFVGSPRWKL